VTRPASAQSSVVVANGLVWRRPLPRVDAAPGAGVTRLKPITRYGLTNAHVMMRPASGKSYDYLKRGTRRCNVAMQVALCKVTEY
jgi:hypothetical protein